MADCKRKGRIRFVSYRGSRNGNAILSETDVATIRRHLANGESHTSIAERYGVSKSAISAISRGQTWAKR